MFKWTARAAVSVIAVAGLFACEAQEKPAADGPRVNLAQAQPVPIVNQVAGDNAALVDPTVRLIKTKNELSELVPEGLAGLDVNFDEQDIVLVALGQQPTGGYWTRIRGIQQVGDVLYVQGVANAPAADAATTQALTHPYAAAVIANTDATMALSDIASVTGQEPTQE